MVRTRREGYQTITILAICILVMSGYAYFVWQKDTSTVATVIPAQQAFFVGDDVTEYTDLTGNQLNLKEKVGKVLVVSSWASWSPDSHQQLLELEKVAAQFTDGQVAVFAINRSEQKNTAASYLKTHPVSESVLLVYDSNDYYFSVVGGYTMPETIIYDQAGAIAHHIRGFSSAAQITGLVLPVLEKNRQEE